MPTASLRIKYKSAYGDNRRLYYPPGAKEKLQDKTIAMVLVESEKAALSMTACAERLGLRLLVLAMGGCWGWSMTSRKHNELGVEVDQKGSLWDLCYVEGREVFVLVDANVATNTKVQSAERALKKMLRRKKAVRIRTCRLPLIDGVNGPDDYIAQCGDEAMLEVLDGKFSGRNPDDDRERIELSGNNRELAEVAEEMGAALRGTLYVHGDDVVEPRATHLCPVKPQVFRTLIAQKIACVRKGKNGEEVIVTMSEAEACGILASPRYREMLWPIERVNICRLPVIRKNGNVELLPEGYDEETATLTVSEVKYRTDMALDDAVKLLRELYSEFEFIDGERSLAVTIAGGMTLYVPHLLPEGALRPCFIVAKNAEGAGATTLVRCMTAPVLGEISFNARPSSDDEMRKLITSIVVAASLSLVFDNVSGVLKSPALEAFLTSTKWRDRRLGSNEMISAPNLATVFITCNGLTISPDMNRRSLLSELHQSYERPGDRKFTKSLDVTTLRQRRPELLAAHWAIVRHWEQKKWPGPSKSNSAFPEWSDIVGGIVEAAGFACPLLPSTSENAAAVDEDGEDMRQLVAAMTLGNDYTFSDLVKECHKLEVFSSLTGDAQTPMTPPQLSKLGKMLARYDNRYVGKRLFVITGNKNSRKSRRYIARAV